MGASCISALAGRRLKRLHESHGKLLKERLDEDEILQLARIAVLNPDNAFVQLVTSAFRSEHVLTFVAANVIGNVPMRDGILITARQPKVNVPNNK